MKINNVSQVLTPSNAALTAPASGSFAVGSRAGTLEFTNVDVGAILLFDTILSAQDLTSVYTYLKNKYGI
jgi:hypothetical protein